MAADWYEWTEDPSEQWICSCCRAAHVRNGAEWRPVTVAEVRAVESGITCGICGVAWILRADDNYGAADVGIYPGGGVGPLPLPTEYVEENR